MTTEAFYDEVSFYLSRAGHDPYSIWVASFEGLVPTKTAARLMAYADNDKATAHVRFLNGQAGIVKSEQMQVRHYLEPVD
jgi:hypothetical protein